MPSCTPYEGVRYAQIVGRLLWGHLFGLPSWAILFCTPFDGGSYAYFFSRPSMGFTILGYSFCNSFEGGSHAQFFGRLSPGHLWGLPFRSIPFYTPIEGAAMPSFSGGCRGLCHFVPHMKGEAMPIFSGGCLGAICGFYHLGPCLFVPH